MVRVSRPLSRFAGSIAENNAQVEHVVQSDGPERDEKHDADTAGSVLWRYADQRKYRRRDGQHDHPHEEQNGRQQSVSADSTQRTDDVSYVLNTEQVLRPDEPITAVLDDTTLDQRLQDRVSRVPVDPVGAPGHDGDLLDLDGELPVLQ